MISVAIHATDNFEPTFEYKSAGDTKWLEIYTKSGSNAGIFLDEETRVRMIAALMTPAEAESFLGGAVALLDRKAGN